MPTLRLTQQHLKDNDYRIDLTFDQYHTATVDVTFSLTPDDQERIRWYLEDYLEDPHDPLPKMAGRIEQKMQAMGVDLFKKVFQGNDDARDLWATLRRELHDTRIELVTGVQEAAAIPWELLRDPKTDTPLALRAQGFVRTFTKPTQTPQVPQKLEPPIRILLVICRPGGRDDAPFRSVAMKILKGLNEEVRKVFQLDVLRPPTFEQLSDTLRRAKEAGTPYHVIHFDGHGAFLDMKEYLLL
ncbi:MAG: CHAT domain-containing protein [bacterium]|nr:CHAT domain-containing protein [bacterium]